MKKIKLLLVDDEKAFLDTITKRLEKRDLDVSTVYSGKEALAEIEKNKTLEVVVLDVKMPEMDGIQTLTGHATVETAIDGMKLGAFDYLMKPCDIDTLIGKVKGAAAKKREHEEKITEARIKEITERRV